MKNPGKAEDDGVSADDFSFSAFFFMGGLFFFERGAEGQPP